ncbi:ATP-dependent helicase [Candidatus Uabimicrobium amorphum]|uniref:ATP-dependent helicase n=1 Tax=Uabimicrobium amorphum TaxID=2596890 RepID=A0A5S9F3H8_UABAM|nr:ATP-dependent helicase [Candidatus Uabimicrobium amorphum]
MEFVLRSGDLRHVVTHKSRLTDAIHAHTLLQEQSPEGYIPEVSLKHTFISQNIHLQVQGRADGIYTNDDGVLIDEIKTTYIPADDIQDNPVHWAQAKMYAFIYSTDNDIEQIRVRLTYFQMETNESHYFVKEFSFSQLCDFAQEISEKYFVWLHKKVAWLEKRHHSICTLNFPFQNLRRGQQHLIDTVVNCIEEGTKLYVQAPTGIGKTIATLYPAIKSIEDKIFYLTAKNTGHQIPQESLAQMRKCGLKCKSIVITAKDKICICETKDINNCEFTTGYFDRINDAINDILQLDDWNAQVIRSYAQKHRLCPYEFSLELSLWADCVICDYNYAFDPRVYLRRFFQDTRGNYIFLVDEAHNLIDRARVMFSAQIEKKHVLEVRRSVKTRYPTIGKKLYKINTTLLQMKKNGEENIADDILEEFLETVQDACNEIDRFIGQKDDIPAELMDFYFSLLAFLRVATEFLDDNYRVHFECKSGDLYLWCINASDLLAKSFAKATSSILFSATLIPMDYCRHFLGAEEQDTSLKLSSPFPLANLGLFTAAHIDTSYRYRDFSYEPIADYIAVVSQSKKGNYLAFFPSYVYLSKVLEVFHAKYSFIDTLEQQRNMNDEDRQQFLQNFTPNNSESLVGFVVLGGIFSEGIDLVGERISGVINVGVGLPQIGTKRNLIRDHFNEKEENGFAYAYAYPGMNRVMQAAGRVIRTETDVGVVLLIGRRFIQPLYRETMPNHWYPRGVQNPQHLEALLESFWKYPRE